MALKCSECDRPLADRRRKTCSTKCKKARTARRKKEKEAEAAPAAEVIEPVGDPPLAPKPNLTPAQRRQRRMLIAMLLEDA